MKRKNSGKKLKKGLVARGHAKGMGTIKITIKPRFGKNDAWIHHLKV